ncbi:MAG: hypothetical protein ABIJ16_09945 [Bacteroidota bacterium]
MKKIIIFLSIIMIVAISASAQDDTPEFASKKHEISFSVSNVFNSFTTFYYPYFYYDLDYEYLYLFSGFETMETYGLGYNFNLGRISLRSSFFFNSDKDSYDYNEDEYTRDETDMNSFIWEGRLGAQWNINSDRAQWYLGMEGFYGNYEYNINYHHEYTNSYTGLTTISESSSKLSRASYGICPLLGIKFFITPAISVGTEAKAYVELFSGSHEYSHTSSSGDVSTDEHSNSGMKTGLCPFGRISVAVHF